MNVEGQLALVDELAEFYDSMPFKAQKNGTLRYYFDNPNFSYSDAIFLHCLMRKVRPGRIIEIGSGYSSCAMLDTNELFFDNAISVSFVEPYPELLHSLLKSGDEKNIEVRASKLQDTPLEIFATLEAGDMLFIDSSHVSKAFSDVNTIFFEILPNLSAGVYVHFHDIFANFEYPLEWLLQGRAWNEAYLLRAFLSYNSAFEIVAMNNFLAEYHEEALREKLPLCLKNPGGSIWLKKISDG